MSHSESQVSFRSSHVLRHSYYGTIVGVVVYFVKKTVLGITYNCMLLKCEEGFYALDSVNTTNTEWHRDTEPEEMGGFKDYRFQKANIFAFIVMAQLASIKRRCFWTMETGAQLPPT